MLVGDEIQRGHQLVNLCHRVVPGHASVLVPEDVRDGARCNAPSPTSTANSQCSTPMVQTGRRRSDRGQGTVQLYFSQLRAKLNVARRQEAVGKAIEERIFRHGRLPDLLDELASDARWGGRREGIERSLC
jgi:hypothetical protein